MEVRAVASRGLRGLIWAYQQVSPLKGGPTCRFYPSCSEYMSESIRLNGPILGTWAGLMRISRCHPWHPGGVDFPQKAMPKPQKMRSA